MTNRSMIAAVVLGMLASAGAQAMLIDRGGGLLYDNVLHITWLQDANYAQTIGFSVGGEPADGQLHEHAAADWSSGLVYHDTARNVDWSDWRLPTARPVNNNSFNYFPSNDGTTDAGYNIRWPQSELGYMYYVNLGLTGFYSIYGEFQGNYGIHGNGTRGAPADFGLVHNLQPGEYWTSWANGCSLCVFDFGDGRQFSSNAEDYVRYVWAVRDGDVVPEPGMLALVITGLGLVGLAVGRKN